MRHFLPSLENSKNFVLTSSSAFIKFVTSFGWHWRQWYRANVKIVRFGSIPSYLCILEISPNTTGLVVIIWWFIKSRFLITIGNFGFFQNPKWREIKFEASILNSFFGYQITPASINVINKKEGHMCLCNIFQLQRFCSRSNWNSREKILEIFSHDFWDI